MVQGASAAPIERYVVLEFLSEGGMGAIYLGKKMGAGGFEKEVVLKQLLPEFTSQPEFIDLFLREARLSATLDHANIIHTIDLVTAGAEHFIVMEYLAGADLRTLAKRAKRRRKRLSPAAAIYIAREVLSALAYAHAKVGPDGTPLRLIHRDVSPSNILVSRNGEVKLTDFGIAKAATHTSVFYKVKGKIGYMSPEQARSEPLDHRSDLYSLMVCVYELLTGERLFVAAGLTTSPEQIYSQPIELPSRKVPGLPPDLDKVILRALALDPADRYQSAGELQEALLRCAHRNSLMISAPELAAHLRQVCGPPEEWRDIGEAGPDGAPGGPGTEVYDVEDHRGDGTEQLDAAADGDDDDDGLDDLVGDLAAARSGVSNQRSGVSNQSGATGPRAATGSRRDRASDRASQMIDLARFQRLELTSMVNLAELEQRGAKPLVDWGDLSARLSSEPGAGPVRAVTATPLPLAEPMPARAARPDTTRPAQRADLSTAHVAPLPPARERPRWLIPLLVALGVIILAGIAAAVIGMSGPDVSEVPTPGAASGSGSGSGSGSATGSGSGSASGSGSGSAAGSGSGSEAGSGSGSEAGSAAGSAPMAAPDAGDALDGGAAD